MLRKLATDEGGTTSIEYALIGVLVAVFLIVALTNLTSMVEVLYSLSSTLVDAAI